jgi:hypothetical protein
MVVVNERQLHKIRVSTVLHALKLFLMLPVYVCIKTSLETSHTTPFSRNKLLFCIHFTFGLKILVDLNTWTVP